MGILDDAIREHLELKRRHGADPGEMERLEREALGAGEVPAPADAKPAAPESQVAVEDAPPAAEPAAEPEAPVAPPVSERPEPEPSVPDAPAEPEHAAPEHAPQSAHVDQPTRQFTLEELEEAERREDEHDELEETPDFLQETPEHDRLWFEQKPPKDFDF